MLHIVRQQKPLTLTLSRTRERGPFGAGRNHSISRHGLLPLPPGEGWGEGKTLAPVVPGISDVGRITPTALSAIAADNPFRVIRPTGAAVQLPSRTCKDFP